MEKQPEEQGEFNQAIAYLYRLDNCLKGLNMASLTNNIPMRYKYLVEFYRELRAMMSKEEKADHKVDRETVREQWEIYEKAMMTGKNKCPAVEKCFELWELDLRDCMKKHGLLMPSKSDPRFALGSKR